MVRVGYGRSLIHRRLRRRVNRGALVKAVGRSPNWGMPIFRRFRRRFQNKYGKNPFPSAKYFTLHYNLNESITSTSGSFGNLGNTMVINSAYDPSGALGATQPRWFDQISAIYQYYNVYGARVSVTFSGSEKSGEVAIAGYDVSAPASMREIDEREDGLTRVINDKTSSPSIMTLKKYFNFPKMMGISNKAYINSEDYNALVTADPANKIYFQAYFQAYGGQTGSMTVKIHITFYCKFSGLQDPSDS